MGGTEPVVGDDDESVGVLDEELAATLHCAVREAAHRLGAEAAAVYLLTPDGTELRAAMIGGGLPAVHTLPGRMALDSFYASARALADGRVALLADPDPWTEPGDGERARPYPYPYTVASVPLEAEGHRFGSLTVLRAEERGGYGGADCVRLGRIGQRLAVGLTGLLDAGTAITPGRLPVLVPVFRSGPSAEPDEELPWGAPGVAGSAGLSLMYPLQRLADVLNRATAMDHVTAAAELCVMAPFRAGAMVLASAAEGRFWVLGHSGDSSDLVRELHGSGLYAPTLAGRAMRGRALFTPGGPGGTGAGDDTQHATAWLPLVGSRHVVDLPIAGGEDIVGVCCLAFDGPRTFRAAERAVLTMMAGLLGSAVRRVDLSAKRQALAVGMQKWLLPPTLAEVPRLTTTARYQPAQSAGEAGGDWYDVITLPDDRVVLVIGDVEGHTMESAAVMGQLRSAVAAYATEGHGPAALLERTGALLARLGTGLLATCCAVTLDTDDGAAEVALAGHPAPLVRLPDGTVRTLGAPANVPLGLTAGTPYRAREHTLPAGAVLMLYSDGLPAADHAEAMLERAGLETGTDLEALADRLLGETPGAHTRRDDSALLLARYERAEDAEAPRTGRLYIRRRDLRGVGKARGFVHDRLCGWGLADMAEDLELVTSEVVTNALVHAGSDVDVRLRVFDDRVRLEVRDSDSDPPVPSAYSLSSEGSSRAEHGRGLFLVDALARTWNTSPSGRGKIVWLEMDIPDAGSRTF
ncbi:SpoIIE family protein phosphatase [Streptomyces tendae]